MPVCSVSFRLWLIWWFWFLGFLRIAFFERKSELFCLVEVKRNFVVLCPCLFGLVRLGNLFPYLSRFAYKTFLSWSPTENWKRKCQTKFQTFAKRTKFNGCCYLHFCVSCCDCCSWYFCKFFNKAFPSIAVAFCECFSVVSSQEYFDTSVFQTLPPSHPPSLSLSLSVSLSGSKVATLQTLAAIFPFWSTKNAWRSIFCISPCFRPFWKLIAKHFSTHHRFQLMMCSQKDTSVWKTASATQCY